MAGNRPPALHALIKTFIPAEFLLQWGDGFMAFVVMALVGRTYVYLRHPPPHLLLQACCFPASLPGATLVFMLVGPATQYSHYGAGQNRTG